VLAAQDRLPLSDMAKNARLGLELARDVERLDPLAFLLHLNRHTTWPFGFSLLLVPGFLLAGPSLAAAALPGLVAHALVPVAMVAIARRVDRGPLGWWSALAAGALYLTSPLPALLAVVVLRETTGLALLLGATAAALWAGERGDLGAWRIAWAVALLVFFVKYNYGLLWALALGLYLVADGTAGARRRAGGWAAGWLWPWGAGRGPGGWERWVFASLALVVALLAGGISVGGVVYGLLVAWTLALAVRWRTLGRRLVGWVRGLPPPARAAVEAFAVPIWVWCLAPDPIHPKAVADFLHNRTSGLGALDGLVFYARVFVTDLAAGSLVAAVVAAGAVVGGAVGWRRGGGWRLVTILTALSIALPLAHPYKQPRFLVTAAGPVFLLAGLGLGWLIGRLGGSRRGWGAVRAGVWLGLAGLLLLHRPLPPAGYVTAGYRYYSGTPRLAPVLAELVALAPRSGRLAAVGTFNELSQDLVEWELARRDGLGPAVLPPPARLPADRPDEEVRAATRRWLAERRPDAILLIRVGPAAPWYPGEDFQRYSLFQQRLGALLLADPGWRTVARRASPDLDLELVLLRPQPAGRRETMPADSSMVSSRPASRSVKRWTVPLGQRTSRVWTFGSRPSPKVSASSLCEQYDEPLWTAACWVPEAEVARTTAPSALRLERLPTSRTRNQRLRLPPSLRNSRAGPWLVVSTTSRSPSRS
jgi:hypothetical protein